MVLVTSTSFESSTIGVEVVVITDPQHVEFLDCRNQGTPISVLNTNFTVEFCKQYCQFQEQPYHLSIWWLVLTRTLVQLR